MYSMQDNEQELIARSLQHDADAYGELVKRYQRTIYRHCFVLLRDEDEAEDVAQETFITAYYKLATFDQSKKLSTWLFKIATNKCLDALRSRKRVVSDDTAIATARATSSYDPDLSSHQNEVREAVNRLRPEYCAVISMYYFDGKSYDEIGDILGKPVGSVKGWMNRAKRELRKELA